MEPLSEIYFPVINNVDTVSPRHDSLGPDQSEVVGILGLSIYWRDLLKNILPGGSEDAGVVVVVDNECGASFTYQVNGPSVVFLGRGDRHDSKFNHLEKSSWLLDLGAFSHTETSYTGPPVDGSKCPFFVRVYPSVGMEETFKTSDPVTFTVVAILIFAFTSAGTFIHVGRKMVRRKPPISFLNLEQSLQFSFFMTTSSSVDRKLL